MSFDPLGALPLGGLPDVGLVIGGGVNIYTSDTRDDYITQMSGAYQTLEDEMYSTSGVGAYTTADHTEVQN